jgi:hypothetical protein
MKIVPLGIDINGLDPAHQRRIQEVGLARWMDEQGCPTATVSPVKRPTRYSLEVRQARMRKRLRVALRKARKPVQGRKRVLGLSQRQFLGL